MWLKLHILTLLFVSLSAFGVCTSDLWEALDGLDQGNLPHYENYRKNRHPPVYHVHNLELDAPQAGDVIQASSRLTLGNKIYLPPRPEVYEISARYKTSDGGAVSELVGPVGNRLYLREADAKKSTGEAIVVRRKDTPFQKPAILTIALNPKRIRLATPINKDNRDEIADQMTTSHIETSLDHGKEPSQQVRTNLKNAIQDLLNVARLGRPLTLTHLARWNATANAELQEFPKNLAAGILRGTVKWVKHAGKWFKVDMQKSEVNASKGEINFYPPASEVPTKMAQLLYRINSITSVTSLKQIAELTHEYYFLHPFIDGNKRTARLLMDYMLLRAGYKPLPHRYNLTASFHHRSALDLEYAMRVAYATGPL